MSYTGTPTPNQINPNSCPCPALPEGMVVVKREILERAYNELNEIKARDGAPYTHYGMQVIDLDYFGSVVDELRSALEKKPCPK